MARLTKHLLPARRGPLPFRMAGDRWTCVMGDCIWKSNTSFLDSPPFRPLGSLSESEPPHRGTTSYVSHQSWKQRNVCRGLGRHLWRVHQARQCIDVQEEVGRRDDQGEGDEECRQPPQADCEGRQAEVGVSRRALSRGRRRRPQRRPGPRARRGHRVPRDPRGSCHQGSTRGRV